MSYKISDNITSPLGNSTEATYQQVLVGHSSLKMYEHHLGVSEPFSASLFTEEQKDELCCEGLTWFEALAYRSAIAAIFDAQRVDARFDASDERTLFVLSTTKGNIAELSEADNNIYLSEVAQRVAARLGISIAPLVVCNACISGLSALAVANRMLEQGSFDYVIVCGVDVQSGFIVSGFQSLGALSAQPCRPFDIERKGLSLGEAAATIVLSASPVGTGNWEIKTAVVRNDAYHNSTPINNGDGLALALNHVFNATQVKPSFVNAHGTATLFNDQMEAMALQRMGLTGMPVNALKGYVGHTMGAAGVLETILCMRSLEDGLALGTYGFEEVGTSASLCISPHHQEVKGNSFVKMLSGFGGCNAVIVCGRGEAGAEPHCQDKPTLQQTHHVSITPQGAEVDGNVMEIEASGAVLLTELYKSQIYDYPKYFKMDGLSRLGFVATELLLQAEGDTTQEGGENRAVVLFNHSSSIDTDRKYLRTISDERNYYPSPSLFVYTLPNIVASEIAIRHRYHGETCIYVLCECNEEVMRKVVEATFDDKSTESVLTGWLDYESDECFSADLYIIEKRQKGYNNMEELIQQLKLQIIDVLNLEGMTPDEINTDEVLFGEGMGLDSIDVLELIVLLDRQYGIKLTNPAQGKEIFRSVRTIAEYVQEHRTK